MLRHHRDARVGAVVLWLLITLAAAVPATNGPPQGSLETVPSGGLPGYGPYSVQSATLTCEALDPSGSSLAATFPTDAAGETFPVVTYTHGCGRGSWV